MANSNSLIRQDKPPTLRGCTEAKCPGNSAPSPAQEAAGLLFLTIITFKVDKLRAGKPRRFDHHKPWAAQGSLHLQQSRPTASPQAQGPAEDGQQVPSQPHPSSPPAPNQWRWVLSLTLLRTLTSEPVLTPQNQYEPC